MKTVLHSVVCIVATLFVGFSSPLSAAPCSTVLIPPVGQCDESVIPASAFMNRAEVFVRLDNVTPGVLSVGVCDTGNNGVTCSLVQREGGPALPADTQRSYSGNLRFYELQHQVSTPGPLLVKIAAGDASQPVELRVGMLRESANMDNLAPLVIICSLFVTLLLGVLMVKDMAQQKGGKNGEYILQTPEGSVRISLSQLPPGASISIGSAASCGVRLNDSQVAGQHGMLVHYSAQLAYKDAGSSGGSFINGQRIQAQQIVILSRGSVLQLGTRVRIRIR